MFANTIWPTLRPWHRRPDFTSAGWASMAKEARNNLRTLGYDKNSIKLDYTIDLKSFDETRGVV
jgi:hypothetical protein